MNSLLATFRRIVFCTQGKEETLTQHVKQDLKNNTLSGAKATLYAG